MKALCLYGALLALSIPVTNYLTTSLKSDVEKLNKLQAERYELTQTTLNY